MVWSVGDSVAVELRYQVSTSKYHRSSAGSIKLSVLIICKSDSSKTKQNKTKQKKKEKRKPIDPANLVVFIDLCILFIYSLFCGFYFTAFAFIGTSWNSSNGCGYNLPSFFHTFFCWLTPMWGLIQLYFSVVISSHSSLFHHYKHISYSTSVSSNCR